MELVIRGGTIVSPDGQFSADIGITAGIIAAIGRHGSIAGHAILDVGGCHVLPGVIDPHVHFREPGDNHKETVETGSAAAAAGGVTLILDMPNTVPPVTTKERFQAKVHLFTGRSWVDFGLWGMALDKNFDDISDLASAGAVGIKVMMAKSSSGRPEIRDGELYHTLATAASCGLRVAVHAENNDIIELMTSRLKAAGRHDLRAHAESRPPLAETEAVRRALHLASAANCPLHIAHLSTARGLEEVRQAKLTGQQVTCETCPHYLYLTEAAVDILGPVAICNPPLRFDTDVERLIKGLSDGSIDCIATDHAPQTDKEKDRSSVWEVLGGIIGVETSLPLMLNKVSAGQISIENLVALMSENVARIFGLFPRKGTIRVGSDADLTIVDMKMDGEIRAERLHSKVKKSPFSGMRVRGWPVVTIAHGHVVMREGKLYGPPVGRFIPRLYAAKGNYDA